MPLPCTHSNNSLHLSASSVPEPSDPAFSHMQSLVQKLQNARKAYVIEKQTKEKFQQENLTLLARVTELECQHHHQVEDIAELKQKNIMLQHLVASLQASSEEKEQQIAQKEEDAFRILSLPPSGIGEEVMRLIGENRWLKDKCKALSHLEKSQAEEAEKAVKAMESLEVEKFKSLAATRGEECTALKGEVASLRAEMTDLREKYSSNVAMLTERLDARTSELARTSLALQRVEEERTSLLRSNQKLAESAFEFKMKAESAELGVRRFLVRKVTLKFIH
jgi:hypothetical protein